MEKRGVKYHRGRLGEALREEIETLVEGELADPRIGLVRVTAVHIADDGRSAQVLVDVDGDDQEAEQSLEGLLAAKEYIRHELVERLRRRRAPELYFRLDRSEREKARVEELLARAKKRIKSRTNRERASREKGIAMLQDVLRQIEQHDRFVLTSHARPDGDAVGSALACCQVLRAMGKQADVVLHDGVPRIYRSLPFADQVVQADRVIGSYDAAIILECDSIHRTRLEGLENRFLISIDHHVSGRPFAHVELDRSARRSHGGNGFSPGARSRRQILPGDCHLPLHRADDRHRIVHVSGNERKYIRSGSGIRSGRAPILRTARAVFILRTR